MVLEKFIPKKPEKEVISMRISTDVLAQLDTKAAEFDISRNELINQLLEYAVNRCTIADN